MIEEGANILATAPTHTRMIAFLPVLVVPDGTLWIADYSSRGDLQRAPFQHTDVTYYLRAQILAEARAGKLQHFAPAYHYSNRHTRVVGRNSEWWRYMGRVTSNHVQLGGMNDRCRSNFG
jgi:hypothetical protein